MPATPELSWDCPVCGTVEFLVQPSCDDGHGADCPDRICVRCTTAFVIDPPRTSSVRRRIAHQRVA